MLPAERWQFPQCPHRQFDWRYQQYERMERQHWLAPALVDIRERVGFTPKAENHIKGRCIPPLKAVNTRMLMPMRAQSAKAIHNMDYFSRGKAEFMTDFEKVKDFNSLYAAYRRSRQGKRGKATVAKFETNLLENLDLLSQQLKAGTYRPQPCNQFYVHEPKKRLVKANAFRDKVVQHSLSGEVLEPILTRSFILDNYAVQVGKGTHYGLDRLRGFIRSYFFANKAVNDKNRRENGLPPLPTHLGNYADGWVLKADIRKYFYTITHEQLKALMRRHFDDEGVLWLIDLIIDSTGDPVGIPIGFLCSQWFALAYLNDFDHFVKEVLKIKYYGRYMDDFFLIHESKDYLKHCRREIERYIEGLGLGLNDKTNIFPLRHGIDFCGFHTYITDTGKVIRKVRKASKEKAKRKLRAQKKRLDKGEITIKDVKSSYQSWRNHAMHGNSYHLTKKTDRQFNKLFKGSEENAANFSKSTQ